MKLENCFVIDMRDLYKILQKGIINYSSSQGKRIKIVKVWYSTFHRLCHILSKLEMKCLQGKYLTEITQEKLMHAIVKHTDYN